MNLQTCGDIPIQITSENSSSERRITPSWTIGHLKARLEPITGIPPLSQRLILKSGSQQSTAIEAADEESTPLAHFPLTPYAEIHVADLRPPGLRTNFTDASRVVKYEMPTEEYERKDDSVLAWKKAQKLGRFDPNAPSLGQAKTQAIDAEIRKRGIEVRRRCRLGGEDAKRGTVMYVGDVSEIPGGAGKWVGIKLDEPVGRNDGSLNGHRYWGTEEDDNGPKFGVFVRPERVEIGDYPPLEDFDDMEEI